MRRRLPLESAETVVWLAVLRLVLVLTGGAALVVLDFPYQGALAAVVLAGALPWAIGLLVLARRAPTAALSPLIAVGDLVILGVSQAVAPNTYAGMRFLALFFIAAHAHFQGEQRGVALAGAGILALVPIGLVEQEPMGGELLVFYEVLFAVSAICAGLFIGRLRTSESAGRLRARDLSRRVLEAEADVRRRVAESIHDGPVQELVGLDIMLSAADRALERGDHDRAQQTLADARLVAERNIAALREEILGLGPYAFDELSLDAAVEQCAPTWRRRYGMDVDLAMERLDLPNDLCGALFGIAQEAVANAGRHAEARRVRISVQRVDGHVELCVDDDGHGFRDGAPLGAGEPGHIGLASMRERAALIEGELTIASNGDGTQIVVRAPVPPGA